VGNGNVVRRFWELMEARDWDAAGKTLAKDVVVDWPHTGERIRGRENLIELNRSYPEPWSIAVRRIVADDVVAAEVAISHSDGVSHCSGFYELRKGRIARATEYWVEAGTDEPPAWRAKWVERP
jgi:ketosteroid isomerase-like protein